MKQYCFTYPSRKLEVTEIKNPCRYHKAMPHTLTNWAPPGMCYDAFFAAYPICLSVLYGAKDRVRVSCPDPTHNIVMDIVSEDTAPKIVVRLKDLAVKMMHKVGYPLEYPLKRIVIRVIEAEGCPAHKVGDEFTFNIWNTAELCPASFSAVFPFGLKSKKVHCPDPRGSVYGCECGR